MRPTLLAIISLLLTHPILSAPTTKPTTPPPANKFESEIQAFEAADQKSFPPPNAILFIGDSSFKFWKSLPEDFPNQPVINRGFGGSRMADALHYADRIVTPYKPTLIVLREGGNDLTAGVTTDQILSQFQAFVKKVRAAQPNVRIALCSLSPNPARWDQAAERKRANQIFKAACEAGQNLDYIEVWNEFLGPDGKPREELFIEDRLHYNSAGYKIYAAALRTHLNR